MPSFIAAVLVPRQRLSSGPAPTALRHDLAEQVDHLGVVGFAKLQVAGCRLPQTANRGRRCVHANPSGARRAVVNTPPSPVRPTPLVRLARLLSALWSTQERPKADRTRRTRPFEGNTLGKRPRDGQKTERCTDTTRIGAESGSRCGEIDLERRICCPTAPGYPIEPSRSCASLAFSATSTADTPEAPHHPVHPSTQAQAAPQNPSATYSASIMNSPTRVPSLSQVMAR